MVDEPSTDNPAAGTNTNDDDPPPASFTETPIIIPGNSTRLMKPLTERVNEDDAFEKTLRERTRRSKRN